MKHMEYNKYEIERSNCPKSSALFSFIVKILVMYFWFSYMHLYAIKPVTCKLFDYKSEKNICGIFISFETLKNTAKYIFRTKYSTKIMNLIRVRVKQSRATKL